MRNLLANIDEKTKVIFLGGLAMCLFTTWVLFDKGIIGDEESSESKRNNTERKASVIFPEFESDHDIEKSEIYSEDLENKTEIEELSSEDFFGQSQEKELTEEEQRRKIAEEKYGDLFKEKNLEQVNPKKVISSQTKRQRLTTAPKEVVEIDEPPQQFSFYSIEKSKTEESNSNDPANFGTTCVIHNEQTIKTGETLRIRLLEDLTTKSGVVLQRSTLLYGAVSLGKERIDININNANVGGRIIPINMEVYSIDGLKGLPYSEIAGSGDVRNQLINNAVSDVSRTSRTPSLLEGLGNSARRTAKEPKITLPNEMKLIIR